MSKTSTLADIVSSNGSLIVPTGSTASRPSANAGSIRFNTDLGTLESANGSAWANVGSGSSSTSNVTSLTGNVYISAVGGIIDASNTSGALILPSGNTIQRPTVSNGAIRWNSSNNVIEGYSNGLWKNVGFTQSYAQGTQFVTTVNTSTPTVIAQVTITSYGRPIVILASGDMNPGSTGDWNWIAVWRGATQLTPNWIGQAAGASWNLPFSYTFIDTPAAGTYTYYLKAWQGTGSMLYGETGTAQGPNIIAIELV